MVLKSFLARQDRSLVPLLIERMRKGPDYEMMWGSETYIGRTGSAADLSALDALARDFPVGTDELLRTNGWLREKIDSMRLTIRLKGRFGNLLK